METLFTWLHLSDLHFRGPWESSEAGRIRAQLQQDLTEFADPKPDAILVTGDIAWSGQPEEYQEAALWLRDTAFAVDLGPARVFVVPGNHDVDREAPRTQAPRRFAAFEAMARGFGGAGRIEAHDGLGVRVIRLNSALRSEGDDKGALLVGKVQLDQALAEIEPGELVVALSHHPPHGQWLANEGEVEAWMAAHGHVYLSGHIHDAAAEEARAGVPVGQLGAPSSPAPFLWIAAGGSRRPGWAMVSVVRGEDRAVALRVWPRRWSISGARFVPDDRALPRGHSFAEHPLRLLAPPRQRAAPKPEPAPKPAPTPDLAPAKRPRPVQRSTDALPRVNPKIVAPTLPSMKAGQDVTRPRPVQRSPSRPDIDLLEAILAQRGQVRPAEAADPSAWSPPAPAPAARKPPPAVELESPGHFEGPGGLGAQPVQHFVGRKDEMTALRAALVAPGITCVVAIGLGGVGKTSLVQHFCATEARGMFTEGAWIDVRELSADLGRVAKRFGWRASDRSPTIEEAARFLRETLAERKVLLVIDNVDPGMADLANLPIPGGKCRTVITSRIVTLHEDIGKHARAIRLGTWDIATCRAHFHAVVPSLTFDDNRTLNDLARRVGCLPLAVRLMAKQLLRPDVTPQRLLARFALEPLTTLDTAAKGGTDRTVASTFKAALEGLGKIERRVLASLATCAPATRAAVVARVAGVREDEAEMTLRGLAEQSLVEWIPEAERPFRLHDVVRILLSSRAGFEKVAAGHATMVREHIEKHREPGDWQALERDVAEVLADVDRRIRGKDGTGAWGTLDGVMGLLDRRGRYGDLVDAAGRILEVVPPDSETAAAVLGALGLCWCSVGEIQKALSSLERALELGEEKRWPEVQAVALGGLGRCRTLLGDLPAAIALHTRAGALHELLGHERLHANDLGNIGLLHRRMGEVGEAIDYLERALAIHTVLGQLDGQAEVLGGLGLCFRDIGELGEAADHFQRALRIQEELGRRAGQAAMLGNLGNTLRALGDVPKAIEHLRRSLAIYEELGLLEGQGTALGNLGVCFRALGDAGQATEHLERALAVLRQAGMSDEHPHVKTVLAALGRRAGRRG
jgi:tetratricopeptide (TPR) repeat protein